MGFAEDLDAILEGTPETRQTALFAATMPARILSVAQRHLRTPQRITIAREKTASGKLPRIRQVAYVVTRPQKTVALQRVLDMESPASALVFCRTRLEVDTLVETLNAHGYRAEALHGGMQQRQRDGVMGRFRSAKTDLLIATDVAGRGIDIEQLSHVFNYDLPSAPEAYVHRIGRTGRAGREGTAITLVEPREHRLLRMIENVTKQKIEVHTMPTVADLRAKRLELTRASLRERILAGNLDDVRVVVQSLAEEFDIVDVAAAAVKLAHAAVAGEDGEREAEIPTPSSRPPREDVAFRGERGNRAQSGERSERPARQRPGGPVDDAEITRLWVGAGREAGIRPADLVGAITNEAGVSNRDLGAIEIADRFSLVEVPAELAQDIIAAMRKVTLRGQKVVVRLDRDAATPARPGRGSADGRDAGPSRATRGRHRD